MATTQLFTAPQLADFVHEDVTDAEAEIAERVAWGWLSLALDLTERPDTPTPQVFAWILELGAIAFENPTALEEARLGDETRRYSAERRKEIVEAARTAAAASSGALAPQGSFPPAPAWPDPICW